MPDPPKLYRPSNGTDGECFIAEFCGRCRFDTEKRPCKVLIYAMAKDVDEPDYPKEWVYGPDGPTCTKFELPGERPMKPRRRHKPSRGQGTLFGKDSP